MFVWYKGHTLGFSTSGLRDQVSQNWGVGGGGCLVTLTDAAKGEGRSPPVNPKTVIDRSQEQWNGDSGGVEDA